MMNQDDNPMEEKKDKTSGVDLGALEKDLLDYQFSDDDDDGEVDEPLLLMTPASFTPPYEGGGTSQLVSRGPSRPGIGFPE